jgi:hypothetical protein
MRAGASRSRRTRAGSSIHRAKEALVGDDGNEILPQLGPTSIQNGTQEGTRDEFAEELERQARETMRTIRESAGELGERVRRVLDHAATLWDQAGPGVPATTSAGPDDDQRARSLARRWRTIDFLVDPELPDGMVVGVVEDAAAWRVELRERGETRSLVEAMEPYAADRVGAPTPLLPLWEYEFPIEPLVEAGERRERLGEGGMAGACLTCNGTGHRPCAHCDGKGFVECPTCHGRARVMCRRCRGRGRIADAEAERRARGAMGYMQVHAERIATDTAGRLADLSERLRQEYGLPLPPSANWLPTAPASGETIPCPDCTDGKVACACGNGKLVCEVCRGSGHAACAVCRGSGRVLRYREVVRRFDTHTHTRVLPVEETRATHPSNHLVGAPALRRASGDEVWAGEVEQLQGDRPAALPERVWRAARELAGEHHAPEIPQTAERRVVSRRVRVTRIPITQVDYSFAGHSFFFIAVGHAGAERFWAETFPPRWSRVGRFFKAIMRDLDEIGGDLPPRQLHSPAEIAVLEEYRAKRLSNGNGAQHVQIIEEPAGQAGDQARAHAAESSREPQLDESGD